MENLKFKKPVEGLITSTFGMRTHPITKKKAFHNGVDIRAKIGTFINVPWDGKISFVSKSPTGGLMTIIQHDNGFKTGYAHLERAIYKVGTIVKAGQVIATVGNTGKSTGTTFTFYVN